MVNALKSFYEHEKLEQMDTYLAPQFSVPSIQMYAMKNRNLTKEQLENRTISMRKSGPVCFMRLSFRFFAITPPQPNGIAYI